MLIRYVLWYKANKHRLVRLVIVRDPVGVENDDYFYTTDLTPTGVQTTTRYAGRWPTEICYREVNQDLRGQDPQSWKGPGCAAALSLWLRAAIWCWYLDTRPEGRTWTPRPWYRHKATPSFLDDLAALRRVLWSQRNYRTVIHQPRQRETHRRPTRLPRLRRMTPRQTAKVHLDHPDRSSRTTFAHPPVVVAPSGHRSSVHPNVRSPESGPARLRIPATRQKGLQQPGDARHSNGCWR